MKPRPPRAIFMYVIVLGVAILAMIALMNSRTPEPSMPQSDDQSGGSAPSGRATVADRLAQYGPQARSRLKPDFDHAKVVYPPSKIVMIGIKDTKRLELWACNPNESFRQIRTYPILGASGGPGPKLREGDRQVPEGAYKIESLNPNSLYHLSLRVNYPNPEDRERAKADGRTNLGGDIMIHGGNASVGCLAMGDPAAEELFVLVADVGLGNIDLLLTPYDFRTQSPTLPRNLPPWTSSLYADLRQRLVPFKKTVD